MYIFALFAIARDLPAGLAAGPANTTLGDTIAVVALNILFLSIGLTIGAFGVYRLLFNAAGRELVVIDTAWLTFRREMPLFTRVRTYRLSDVRNLRATHSVVPFWVSRWGSDSRYAFDLFGLTGGVIAFDYSGRTIRVGGGIGEAEARHLVARILQRHPSLGTTSQ